METSLENLYVDIGAQRGKALLHVAFELLEQPFYSWKESC